jgi:hypothetical protein
VRMLGLSMLLPLQLPAAWLVLCKGLLLQPLQQ